MLPASMMPRSKRPPPKKQQPKPVNDPKQQPTPVVVLAGQFNPTTGIWGGQWAMTAQELGVPAKSSVHARVLAR